MNRVSKTAHQLAYSPYAVALATVASVASFAWLVYDKAVASSSSLASVYGFAATATLFGGVHFYSLAVRRENSAWRQMTTHLHQINHLYRDTLYKVLSVGGTPLSEADVVSIERDTLTAVCQRIEKVYSSLVGRECMVTVKLITEGNDRIRRATTYTRSMKSERDNGGSSSYEVGTGKNTAFDRALEQRAEGISHFHSGDLIKDRDAKSYCNERQHFDRHYKSTIVVPIRCIRQEHRGTRDSADDVGFLTVDTLSRNRLNNDSHVELLAAMADQMYNFISLLRGKYQLRSRAD